MAVSDKEIRRQAVELAVRAGAPTSLITSVAEQITQFILNGTTVGKKKEKQ